MNSIIHDSITDDTILKAIGVWRLRVNPPPLTNR